MSKLFLIIAKNLEIARKRSENEYLPFVSGTVPYLWHESRFFCRTDSARIEWESSETVQSSVNRHPGEQKKKVSIVSTKQHRRSIICCDHLLTFWNKRGERWGVSAWMPASLMTCLTKLGSATTLNFSMQLLDKCVASKHVYSQYQE